MTCCWAFLLPFSAAIDKGLVRAPGTSNGSSLTCCPASRQWASPATSKSDNEQALQRANQAMSKSCNEQTRQWASSATSKSGSETEIQQRPMLYLLFFNVLNVSVDFWTAPKQDDVSLHITTFRITDTMQRDLHLGVTIHLPVRTDCRYLSVRGHCPSALTAQTRCVTENKYQLDEIPSFHLIKHPWRAFLINKIIP